MKSDLDSTAATHSGLLKKSWHRFNRWRKQYLWIRLLFLLLFGAYVCREAFFPLTPRLHRFYTEALFAEYEPSLVDALARSRKVRLSRQLQVALSRTADRDGNGVLNEQEEDWIRDSGLDPEELREKSVRADLPRLMAACHRAGLLPKSFTLRAARREARFAAVAEVENLNRPVREEIDGILKAWEMPDYSRLETWKRGAMLFLRWLEIPVLMLGRPRTVVAWLLSCFLLSLTITSFVTRRRLAVGLLVGLFLSFPIFFWMFTWTVVIVPSFVDVFFRLDLPGALLLLAALLAISRSKKGGVLRRIRVVAPLLILAWNFLFAVRLGEGECGVVRVSGTALVGSAIGWVCLGIACAGFAGRVASGPRSRGCYFSAGMVGLGLVLLAWTAARQLPSPRLSLGACPVDVSYSVYTAGWAFELDAPWEAHWDWLFWVWVPRWITRVTLPVGAACLTAGLAASPTVARLRRRGRTHRSSEVEADDKPREK